LINRLTYNYISQIMTTTTTAITSSVPITTTATTKEFEDIEYDEDDENILKKKKKKRQRPNDNIAVLLLQEKCSASKMSDRNKGCFYGHSNPPFDLDDVLNGRFDVRKIKVPPCYFDSNSSENYFTYNQCGDDIKLYLQLQRAKIRFSSAATLLTIYSPFLLNKHLLKHRVFNGIQLANAYTMQQDINATPETNFIGNLFAMDKSKIALLIFNKMIFFQCENLIGKPTYDVIQKSTNSEPTIIIHGNKLSDEIFHTKNLGEKSLLDFTKIASNRIIYYVRNSIPSSVIKKDPGPMFIFDNGTYYQMNSPFFKPSADSPISVPGQASTYTLNQITINQKTSTLRNTKNYKVMLDNAHGLLVAALEHLRSALILYMTIINDYLANKSNKPSKGMFEYLSDFDLSILMFLAMTMIFMKDNKIEGYEKYFDSKLPKTFTLNEQYKTVADYVFIHIFMDSLVSIFEIEKTKTKASKRLTGRIKMNSFLTHHKIDTNLNEITNVEKYEAIPFISDSFMGTGLLVSHRKHKQPEISESSVFKLDVENPYFTSTPQTGLLENPPTTSELLTQPSPSSITTQTIGHSPSTPFLSEEFTSTTPITTLGTPFTPFTSFTPPTLI
jgi:hypothetical protein